VVSKATPTSRTLAELRDDGWTAEVVEKWNPHARVRNDLYGFIDILAVRGAETLAVQATSSSNVASRVRKIADHVNVAAVREAGWRIEVWGWGWSKREQAWTLRKVDVS
jgi:hypothetical protein